MMRFFAFMSCSRSDATVHNLALWPTCRAVLILGPAREEIQPGPCFGYGHARAPDIADLSIEPGADNVEGY